jgi:hypothetical protein
MPIPFIAAAGASLAKPLIKWGIVAAVIGALFGLWRWERHDRVAAEKGEAAALERLDLAQQDATRWHTASDLRDQAISQLKAALDRQSAAIEAQRADEARLAAAVRAGVDRNRILSDRLAAATAALEEQAHAHPEDDRPLGPIGLQFGKLLFARPE